MHEFDLIDRYLKPLAEGYGGSLGLADDAALVGLPDGYELVITKDAVSEGVHFIGNEDPALIARKLLRVNLSDLAAKGATPLCYFLALLLPKHTDTPWIERFADGLAQDQAEFAIHLAGGDTIATQGAMSFSITALGTVKSGTMLRRNGAKAGDKIVVTGTLGDSAIGLALLQDVVAVDLSGNDLSFLETRYFLPQPRLKSGLLLAGIASAGMDISDGLVQDLGHICTASGVGATIEADKLPLSDAARHAIEREPDLSVLPLTGGDDYELLFTVPADRVAQLPPDCTVIGSITQNSGVSVIDGTGQPVELKYKGFQHF